MANQTIDLTPTPEGFRHMVQLFRETLAGSEEKLAQLDALTARLDRLSLRFTFKSADEFGLITDALDALETVERQRVRMMREALEELGENNG